jgi:hypothetical protein
MEQLRTVLSGHLEAHSHFIASAVASFVRSGEHSGVDWSVHIVSSGHSKSVAILRDAEKELDLVLLPSPSSFRAVIHGKYGFIRCASIDPTRLLGVTGDHLLWVVVDVEDDDCWDAIETSVVDSTKIIAVHPPQSRMHLFYSGASLQ